MSKELKKLRDENRRLQASLNAFAEQAEEKVSYYSDLVWLARRTDEEQQQYAPNFFEKACAKLGKEAFAQFMDDANNLSNPDNTQRHHGFNSGVFAAGQLFLEIVTAEDEDLGEDGVWTAEAKRKNAVEEFPDLDN